MHLQCDPAAGEGESESRVTELVGAGSTKLITAPGANLEYVTG